MGLKHRGWFKVYSWESHQIPASAHVSHYSWRKPTDLAWATAELDSSRLGPPNMTAAVLPWKWGKKLEFMLFNFLMFIALLHPSTMLEKQLKWKLPCSGVPCPSRHRAESGDVSAAELQHMTRDCPVLPPMPIMYTHTSSVIASYCQLWKQCADSDVMDCFHVYMVCVWGGEALGILLLFSIYFLTVSHWTWSMLFCVLARLATPLARIPLSYRHVTPCLPFS